MGRNTADGTEVRKRKKHKRLEESYRYQGKKPLEEENKVKSSTEKYYRSLAQTRKKNKHKDENDLRKTYKSEDIT